MSAPRVVSVRVGRVRTLERPDWDRSNERTWQTAYLKDEVAGPVRVGTLGLDGDEVFSIDDHGGPQMAVLAYAADHYPAWRAELGLEAMGPGGFGENLTIEGLDEHSVCIGDTYEVGEVRLQVSQPRGPCSGISRRWGVPTLLKRVVETGWTGWYQRVLREGMLERGQEVRLVARPHPLWSVARLQALRLAPERDLAALAWLAACEELSPQWREMYAEHAARLG